MDVSRFDVIVADLGSRLSRRTVCGGLTRALVAIVPALAMGQPADARKRRDAKKRRKAKKRKGAKKDRCDQRACDRRRCRYRCVCGVCVCPKDWRRCGDLCYPRCGRNRPRDPETCECP